MNRTRKNKFLYAAVIVISLAVAIIAWAHFELGPIGWLVLALLLLLPGRVGGYVLRDLFRGRHFVEVSQYEKAIAASKRFLDVVDRQPWRRYLLYCFFSFYTWNARAMALNNIGAAKMELGQLNEAEKHLAEALELDEAYPIPYYNLAIIFAAREDHERSAAMLTKSRQLGYSQSPADMVITRVAAAYARLQSRAS